jgi:hypothetical protein
MENPAAVRNQADKLLLAHSRGRPITTADTRLLQISGALKGCFPDGMVRRGSTLVIHSAGGGVSLALALTATVTAGEAWAAAVGLPSLGLLAATELGVNLERLALIPAPGDRWLAVAAALLEGMDLVLLGPPGRVRRGDARRLVARAREQGTVLAVLEPPGALCWPEAPDFRLSIADVTWEGLGWGHGHLQSRRVEVVTTGRRAAARERRTVLWLPGHEDDHPAEMMAPVPMASTQPAAAGGQLWPALVG